MTSCHHKMTWIIPTYSNKMAESQDVPRSGNIFVGEQSRALLGAMEYFENERHRGRAGRGPITVHVNGVGRIVGQGRVYHMVGSLYQVPECQNQGSLFQKREGQRSLSPNTHHHTSINSALISGQRISYFILT